MVTRPRSCAMVASRSLRDYSRVSRRNSDSCGNGAKSLSMDGGIAMVTRPAELGAMK